VRRVRRPQWNITEIPIEHYCPESLVDIYLLKYYSEPPMNQDGRKVNYSNSLLTVKLYSTSNASIESYKNVKELIHISRNKFYITNIEDSHYGRSER